MSINVVGLMKKCCMYEDGGEIKFLSDYNVSFTEYWFEKVDAKRFKLNSRTIRDTITGYHPGTREIRLLNNGYRIKDINTDIQKKIQANTEFEFKEDTVANLQYDNHDNFYAGILTNFTYSFTDEYKLFLSKLSIIKNNNYYQYYLENGYLFDLNSIWILLDLKHNLLYTNGNIELTKLKLYNLIGNNESYGNSNTLYTEFYYDYDDEQNVPESAVLRGSSDEYDDDYNDDYDDNDYDDDYDDDDNFDEDEDSYYNEYFVEEDEI